MLANHPVMTRISFKQTFSKMPSLPTTHTLLQDTSTIQKASLDFSPSTNFRHTSPEIWRFIGIPLKPIHCSYFQFFNATAFKNPRVCRNPLVNIDSNGKFDGVRRYLIVGHALLTFNRKTLADNTGDFCSLPIPDCFYSNFMGKAKQTLEIVIKSVQIIGFL